MKEILKKEIKFVSNLNISKNTSNTQGNLFLVRYNNELYVEKPIVFLDDDIYKHNVETLYNLDKYRKILPNNFCLPEYFVEYGGRYIAFLMPYLHGKNLTDIIYSEEYSVKEQLEYIKKIGMLLDELKLIRQKNNLDIYINDLNESNFIANNRNIKVVDLDTSLINSKYAYKAKYLNSAGLLNFTKDKYDINKSMTPGYVIANEQSDLYCYNMLILNYLYGKNNKIINVNYFNIAQYNDFINYLYKIGISTDLINSFDKIVSYEENVNPYRYLDLLTENQVELSRQYSKSQNYFKLF